MPTLDQLLSSPERLRLARFFLFHPGETVTLRDLKTRLGGRVLKNRRPLGDLVKTGVVVSEQVQGAAEATYRANTEWVLFKELSALFVKAQLLVERDLVQRLQRLGSLKLLILTGFFVGDSGAGTDLLMVGRLNHQTVKRLLREFERDLDREVNYTVLTPNEYQYRKNVGDRFLYDILEGRHLVVVDEPFREKPQRGQKKARKRLT